MLLNSLYFSGSVGPLVSVQHDGDPDEVIVGGWQIEVLRRTLIPCRRNNDWIPCYFHIPDESWIPKHFSVRQGKWGAPTSILEDTTRFLTWTTGWRSQYHTIVLSILATSLFNTPISVQKLTPLPQEILHLPKLIGRIQSIHRGLKTIEGGKR